MRSQVERFKISQAHEIARLMGSLAFSRRLPRSPYAHLLEDSQWDTVARDFARHCCGLLGLVRSCMYLLNGSQIPLYLYAFGASQCERLRVMRCRRMRARSSWLSRPALWRCRRC